MFRNLLQPFASRFYAFGKQKTSESTFSSLFQDWLDAINSKLEEEFSNYWDKKKNKFYVDESSYILDTRTINKNLRDPIKDFVLRGGKRVRPLLFFTLLEVFGKNPLKYMEIALAIELAHNGTLVLDDIEDGAELRRSMPTSHIKYGLDTAVNMGAGLHIVPIKYLLNNNLSAKTQNRLIKIFSEELINVTFGQTLDIYWHKNGVDDVKVNKYLEMVRLKTGSLMRMSVRLACAVAETDAKTEKLFSEFAEKLGMAFQIIDDSLDLESVDNRFGKAFGNDITEGKISLPVTYTLKRATVEDKSKLTKILFMHTRNRVYIKQAVDIINSYKSIESSRVFAKNLLYSAWQDLNENYKKNGLSRLNELSKFVLNRNF